MEYGIGEVQGDQLTTRECYLAMLAMDEQIQIMNMEERRMLAKPIKLLEDVPLDESNLVDTQFCTHDLIKENDSNDHPCTQKKKNT